MPEGIGKKPLTGQEESPDKTIERGLEQLPPELRNTWLKRYESAGNEELPQLADELRNFISRREQARSRSSEKLQGIRHLTTDPQAISRTLTLIGNIERDRSQFIKGGTFARVYKDPQSPAICHKFIYNFREYTDWNTVEREARFMEELEGFEVDGARVPRLMSVIDLPQMKVLSMEYMDAPDVDTVLQRKRKLPNGFDVNKFFDRLYKYVERMHTERNIYHRDLNLGNVLIGEESTPYVIDFGKAAQAITPEFAYETRDKVGNPGRRLLSDEELIYRMEVRLRPAASSLRED